MSKISIVTSILFLSFFHAFSQAPEAGLLLHMPFNNSMEDQSGHGFYGINHGATNRENRFFEENSSLFFDGDDHVEILDPNLLKIDFPFTVSLWLEIEEYPELSNYVFTNDELQGYYSGAYIGYTPTGSFVAGIADGVGTGFDRRYSQYSQSVFDPLKWYHLAAVYHDYNDIDLYVNAYLDKGQATGGADSMAYVGGKAILGRNIGFHQDSYHKGRMDDLRIYSRALDKEEIPYLYHESPCNIIPVYDTVYISVRDTLIIDVLLDYDDITQTNQISVYPNPAKDILFIHSGEYFEAMSEYSIHIISSDGKQIFNTKVEDQLYSIDIQNFESVGLFFLQILDENGSLITTKKIVLE